MSADIPGAKLAQDGSQTTEVKVGSQTIVVPEEIVQAQRKVGYPFNYLIIVTPLVALVVYFIIIGQKNEASLAAQISQDPIHTTATATVVTTPERRYVSYDLSYAFADSGSNQKYTNTAYSTDATSSLDTEEFNRLSTKLTFGFNINAQNGYSKTGPISIVYDGHDPTKNLTQFDLKTIGDPNKFLWSATIIGFLVWLIIFVPLGFLVRLIIRQNIWFRYQGKVLRQLREERLQQATDESQPSK
jgi:hypothetical protein